jgi:hypothetical protein
MILLKPTERWICCLYTTCSYVSVEDIWLEVRAGSDWTPRLKGGFDKMQSPPNG